MKCYALLIEDAALLDETLAKTHALLDGTDITLTPCDDVDQAENFLRQYQQQDHLQTPVVFIIFGIGLVSTLQTAHRIYAIESNAQLLFWSTDKQYSTLLAQLQSPVAGIGNYWQILSYQHTVHHVDIKQLLAKVTQRFTHQLTVQSVNSFLASNISTEMSKLQRYSLSLSFLNKIFADAHDAIIVTTSEGVIVRWNKAAQHFFGLTHEQALGLFVQKIKQGNWNTVIAEMLVALFEPEQEYLSRELDCIDQNRQLVYLEVSLSKIKDELGEVIGFSFIIHDITQRKLAELELDSLRQELEKLSFLDQLTGIANRRKFDMVMQNEWSRAMRQGNELSLMMIDVDFFKQYNDNYGHQQGDKCLKKIAGALRSVFKRQEDLVVRYGGEEFAVLQVLIDHQQAKIMAEKCLQAVAKLNIAHGYSSVGDFVSVSIGLYSQVPQIGQSHMQLIELADQQLYQAKANGRNRIECGSG